MLADRLVDRFVSTGLMSREYDHVKLHVTIMNTLMRKDPTGTSEPRQVAPRGHAAHRDRERESFDAQNILNVSDVQLIYVIMLQGEKVSIIWQLGNFKIIRNIDMIAWRNYI